MLGVAASTAEGHAVLTAGVAGLFAGALSMAVGEFVSVGSQRDAERADVEREKRELSAAPEAELRELAGIYRRRGLSDALALQVATALSAHDRLGAHLDDELGLEPGTLANRGRRRGSQRRASRPSRWCRSQVFGSRPPRCGCRRSR